MILYETAAFLTQHLEQTYLFNPLTFHQDHITNKKWTRYKKPVRVEYMVVRDHSWKIRYTIGEGEALTIFKELKF